MADLPRINSFIGGDAAPAGAGAFDLVDPQTGNPIGTIVEAGEAGVAAAVNLAKSAYEAHRKSPVHQRVKWLREGAAALRQAVEEIAPLISRDVGKPIRVCRGEIARGAEFMEAVAACMTAYAHRLDPENADRWTVCGILHDFDYEKHPTPAEHPFVGVKHLESLAVDDAVRTVLLGHAE